ncbi:MAG: hypothetical protein HC912_01690 [Saprospiraceae bacterium]|nr:hypothetical protein [Saprospiraceae bacterium]
MGIDNKAKENYVYLKLNKTMKQTIFITGANSGLGFETALQLANKDIAFY